MTEANSHLLRRAPIGEPPHVVPRVLRSLEPILQKLA